MSLEASLTLPDYVVATLVLLIPMAMGIWYALRDAHTASKDEYLLGGRRMGLLPVTLSLFISFQSANAQMGLPMETFYYGGVYMLVGVGLGLSYLVGCFTLVPLLYPLRITSIYEYLKLRYKSEVVRLFCTVIGMMTTVCYMAVVLLSPALALQATANFPLWLSILVFGAVGTVYTAIGGFKSVVWTDVFQTLVIFIGILIILFKACLEVGGLGEVWRLSQAGGRTDFNRFKPDPTIRHSFWGLTVGHCFVWLVNEFNQSTLQRISSMKSERAAKLCHVILMPLIIVYHAVFGFLGLVIYAYFTARQCDPHAAGFMSNRNQLAPFFVVHLMRDMPGMVGLYVSILCCGALSSISSGINALAANTVEDILHRPLRNLREATVVSITKLIAVFYGSVIIGLAYLANGVRGPILQMVTMVFSVFGSPILGIFAMGASVPWANMYGALTGAAVTLGFNLWLGVGGAMQAKRIKPLPPLGIGGCANWTGYSNITLFLNETFSDGCHEHENSSSQIAEQCTEAPSGPPENVFFLYRVSYEWYCMLGTVLCVGVGLSVSYVSNLILAYRGDGNTDSKSTEACYIFPFLRKFWSMDVTEPVRRLSDPDSGLYGRVELHQVAQATKT